MQTDDDKNFLLRLYVDVHEAGLIGNGWPVTETQSFLEQQFAAQYHSYGTLYPDAEFQIVEYRGQAIGRLGWQRDESECLIIDIALLAEYRNHGMGRQLIRNIQESAAVSAVPVSLHVEHGNPAIRLYQYLGFEVVEDQGVHLLMHFHPVSRVKRDDR